MSIRIRFFLSSVAILLPMVVAVACAPLSALNALTPSYAYQMQDGRPYGQHPRQRLDVYVPRDGNGAAPVVVFFYGGSWNSGDRSDYAFVGEALASRGIVAVVADYRLYPEVKYPAFLEDAAAAVAWTAREIGRHGGDPRRMYLMGHSAGAYNAAMLALDRRLLAAQGVPEEIVRGWIGLAGPYDFIPIRNPAVRPVFFHPDTPLESQPVNHVTRRSPPALLIAPREDDLVDPVRNTGGMAKRLRAGGVDVAEHYFDSTGHISLVVTLSRPLRSLAPTLDLVEQFVRSDGGRLRAVSSSR